MLAGRRCVPISRSSEREDATKRRDAGHTGSVFAGDAQGGEEHARRAGVLVAVDGVSGEAGAGERLEDVAADRAPFDRPPALRCDLVAEPDLRAEVSGDGIDVRGREADHMVRWTV